METNENKARSGARKILFRCLSLEAGDDVVIFCDETTVEVASLVAQVAAETGIEYHILLEPVALQPLHNPEEDLSWPVKNLLDKTNAILTCLNDLQDCLPFRRRIIANGLGAFRRIGHMPGASLMTLCLADADYEQIQKDCADLALALAKGQHVRLTTWDPKGQEYVLEADIGGWDQMPVASDGVIPRGAWGNIPGGETYIAPVFGTADGKIVINVALPGRVLSQTRGRRGLWQEHLILCFEQGALAEYYGSSEALVQVIESKKHLAEQQGDGNWRNLGEIGLGTNRSIQNATGTSLIDEKIYGTAHIAIGNNLHHGGTNRSVIHCDMVTFARVEVDNKKVLEEGEICFRPSEWLEHIGEIEPRGVEHENAWVRCTRFWAPAQVGW
jgi:leucyl aminopeptidase (aminopeptidase T)